MKIIIDPACDMYYSSFYIKGLIDTHGKKNIKYSSKFFQVFEHNNLHFRYVIKNKKKVTKVIIDFTDTSKLSEVALKWCDHYGKINLEEKDASNPKVFPIGPGFGIQIYSLSATIYYALTNYVKAFKRIPDPKRFFADYKGQYKRAKLSSYKYTEPKPNYIFFLSTLWRKDHNTNLNRANYIKSCKEIDAIDFEGGFAPRDLEEFKQFKPLMVQKRISIEDFIKKSQESHIVFNTPAVKDCHGWKLAEFLCLGKIILSTPFLRLMPEEIRNNESIMWTNGELDNIHEKISQIIKDPELQDRMKTNAISYFNKNLAPNKVIERINKRTR